MERIYFRKFRRVDFDDYLKLCSNEDVMNMNFGRVFTIEETKFTFDVMMKSVVNKYAGYYKVYESESESYIGIGAMTLSEDFTVAEIEYMILPEFWGKGYGSEIAEEMVSKASEVKSVKKVTAYTDPENIRSKKILTKLGFKAVQKFITSDNSEAEEFELEI